MIDLQEQLVTQHKRPLVVCLCGSTRFMDTFFEVGWQETLKGNIVLSVGVVKHSVDHAAEALGPDVVEALDLLHLRKIDMADRVLILNVDGYIGESTARERAYAVGRHIPIEYLEPFHDLDSASLRRVLRAEDEAMGRSRP